MNYLTRIALVFLFNAVVPIVGNAASKRGFINLAEVITIYTGRSALDYNGYGCYCGLGGSGTPVDAVDRCCQVLDNCYDDFSCLIPKQFFPTKQECKGGSCKCKGDAENCAFKICTCDIKFGECLRDAPYILENKGKC